MMRRPVTNLQRSHLALPGLALVTVAGVVPLLILVVLSFFVVENYNVVPAFSLRAWSELVARPFYAVLIGKAVLYGVAAVVVTALAGYPIALAILRLRPSHKAVVVMLLMSPLYVGEVVRLYAWRLVLGATGLANYILMSVGAVDTPVSWLLFSPFATILVLVYNNLPLMVIVLWISLERIDRSILEVARDLGARPFTVFLRIVLPLTLPGLAAGSFIVYALAAGDILTPRYIGGASGATALEMLDNLFGSAFDWPMASALSLALLAALALPAVILARVLPVNRALAGGRRSP